ncbi:10641_t:CDS:2, partial [Ambispora gerdemannii]
QQQYPLNMPVAYTSSAVGPQVNNEAASKHHQNNHHNSSGASKLAEFASNMVYQMWHFKRPSSALAGQYVAPPVSNPKNISPTASPQFKSFCNQVLQQTQLSESVVLLSLKYVQKLVKSGTMSTGDKGSEYRLFTVALMLANKFLDDNTFTNKTWSEVTNISVKELNIMELEFLDNLDFKLFVSDTEYKHWLQCLNEYTQKQHQQTQKQHQQSLHQRNKSASDATLRNAASNTRSALQQPYKYTLISMPEPYQATPISIVHRRQPKTQTTATINSNVIQPPQPPIGRVQPHQSFGLVSPVPAKQVLINSYYGSNRNPNNNSSSNGSTSHSHHLNQTLGEAIHRYKEIM